MPQQRAGALRHGQRSRCACSIHGATSTAHVPSGRLRQDEVQLPGHSAKPTALLTPHSPSGRGRGDQGAAAAPRHCSTLQLVQLWSL